MIFLKVPIPRASKNHSGTAMNTNAEENLGEHAEENLNEWDEEDSIDSNGSNDDDDDDDGNDDEEEEDLTSPLISAVANGNLAKVRRVLEQDADMNERQTSARLPCSWQQWMVI